MPDSHAVCVDIHSPRWGHSDTYTIVFQQESIEITGGGGGLRKASCTRDENGNREWSGQPGPGNPLMGIMRNDMIYPPDIFIFALEHAWDAWRDGELKNEQLTAEIVELFAWVNAVTESRPQTEYWRTVF